MSNYIVYNQTSYGDGIYFVGTTRSPKLAQRIVAALHKDDDLTSGDGWNYKSIESIDKYDPEDLIRWLKEGNNNGQD